MNNDKVTKADIRRFQELDARWRGEQIPGKPLGLTADEPSEHRRLASKLARQYVFSHVDKQSSTCGACDGRGSIMAKRSHMCTGTADCQCCNGADDEVCALCSGQGRRVVINVDCAVTEDNTACLIEKMRIALQDRTLTEK